jgi:Ca2+-binding EF-hand superfamily protein
MEFIIGLGNCVKLSTEEKIKYLFNVYDVSNNNVITRQDLLMMLYNYPREDLEKITNDPIFLTKNGLNMSKVDFSCNNSMVA